MRVTKRALLRGALVGLLVLLVLNLALLWAANRALRSALAEAPDLKLRMQDFAPPPIPTLENASNYMNAAGGLCSVSPDEVRALAIRQLDPNKPAKPPADVWREIVRRNALALQIVDAAAQRERAWFETEYDPANPFARLPPLLQRRSLANTLRARARLAAHEGRASAAYRDVLLILRLGDWCGQESPTLISGLIGIAVAKVGLDTLEDVMSSATPDSESRRALGERLSATRTADPVRRGLEGERTGQFGIFEAMASGTAQLPGDIAPALLLRHPLRFYLRFEQAASLHATSVLIRRCDRATYELEQSGQAAEVAVPSWLVITSVMVPSLHRAIVARDELRAQVDLGQLALDADRYREAQGSYPPGPIESWSSTKAIDPLTGSRYVYELQPGGFRLRGPRGRYPNLTWTVVSATPPIPVTSLR